jgi:predicted nucleic acid-binding protein
MNIILDTNVLFNDWTLRSADSQAFLDYVENTGSTIYVPRIVWEEIEKNQQEDLAKKHEAYETACKRLGGSMINQPDFKVVKFEHAITGEEYLEWLRKKLRFDVLENVLPYGDYTERIAKRVMTKRKPFNLQNSNEYKDTLVWETVLDVIAGKAGKKDEEVVFISNDTNAFGAGKSQQENKGERGVKGERQVGVLHPQLQEDIDAVLANHQVKRFYYYETFAEFLAAHYTPIKGINKSAVLRYLTSEESGFLQAVQGIIVERLPEMTAEVAANNMGVSVLTIDTPFTLRKFSVLQDFYVYSSNKGEQVIASGRVFVYMRATVAYSFTNQEGSHTATLYPIVEVKLNIPYQDGKPTSIVFDETKISPSSWLRLTHPALQSDAVRENLIRKLSETIFEVPDLESLTTRWHALLNTHLSEKYVHSTNHTLKSPVDPANRKRGKKGKK